MSQWRKMAPAFVITMLSLAALAGLGRSALPPPARPGDIDQKDVSRTEKDLRYLQKADVVATRMSGHFSVFMGVPPFSPKTNASDVTVASYGTTGQATASALAAELKRMVTGQLCSRGGMSETLWLRLYFADKHGKAWVYLCRYMPDAQYLELYARSSWPAKPAANGAKGDRLPKGAVRLRLQCRTTPRFNQLIAQGMDPKARAYYMSLN